MLPRSRARMIAFLPDTRPRWAATERAAQARWRGPAAGGSEGECESRSSRSTLSSWSSSGCCRSCSSARRWASATSNKDQLTAEAQNDVNGAAARLQLDGLRAERWLAGEAAEPATLDALAQGHAVGARRRGDEALRRPRQHDEERAALRAERPDARRAGRHERQHRRAERLEPEPRRRHGRRLRRPQATLVDGPVRARTSGTSSDRYLASYVAVRDDAGQDHRRARHRPAAQRHALAGQRGDDRARRSSSSCPRATARGRRPLGTAAAQPLDESVGGAAKDMLKNALSHQQTDVVRDGDLLVAVVAAARRSGTASARCSSPRRRRRSSRIPPALALLPIFGAMALGLILVIVGRLAARQLHHAADQHARGGSPRDPQRPDRQALRARSRRARRPRLPHRSAPQPADGRRGRHDRRRGPRLDGADSAANFSDAMAVDDKRRRSGRASDARSRRRSSALAAEPPTQYYARIYREYIAAKKAIGEQTDHITEAAFAARIQGMEQDAAQKYGRPVRYQVQRAEQRGRPARCPLCLGWPEPSVVRRAGLRSGRIGD